MEATAASMLVNELMQGHGLAVELESQLNSASLDLCKSLAHEMLASIEKAISMAKFALAAAGGGGGVVTDSPRSFAGSPHSAGSDLPPFKADRKKKKTEPKWTTNQVKLGTGPEAEGPLEDGYSWRKYGQKEILGAKFPRGYYRCTHLNTQGCTAKKHVQQSDDNPAISHVTYRGAHTCLPKSSPSSPPPATKNNNNELLLSFQTNLKVETESLDSKYLHQPSPFFFPSTPVDAANPESRRVVDVSTPSTPGNCFKRSFTDAFLSPATPESGLSEIFSGAASSNSCLLDLDFLDDDFPFDCSSFFS